MDRRRSLLKIAALRSEREQQVGVDCTKGYLESTDAGLLFDGPRSMECFFNLRQSDGTQRPAQFSTSMLAIAVTPMDAIMFHCGDKSLQVSRVTIGDDIHVVISYDGATAMCYINGIEVGAMQPTAYTLSALFRIGDPLHITKSPIHFCRHFNYALSAEEVVALYNNGDPAGYVLPIPYKYKVANYISDFSKNTDGWSTVANYPGTSLNSGDGILSIYGDSTTLAIQKQDLSSGDKPSIFRIRIVFVEPFQGSRIRFFAHSFNDYADLTLSSEKLNAEGVVHIKNASNAIPNSFMYSYDVPIGDVVKISTITIESVGCVAEYLPQNLMIAQKRDFPQVVFPVAGYTPSSGVFNLNNLSATIKKNDQPQANGFSGAYTRFDAITSISLYCAYISDFIKKQAPLKITFEYRSNRILYSSNITASPAASDAVAIDVNEGDAKIASVSCGVGATAFVFSDSAPEAWLEMRVLSIEVAEGVALAWLDSAKQLPLNDEYLPPLLQSDGGYGLAASGMPQIIIK